MLNTAFFVILLALTGTSIAFAKEIEKENHEDYQKRQIQGQICQNNHGICITNNSFLDPFSKCDTLIKNDQDCIQVGDRRATCCVDCFTINKTCETDNSGSVGRWQCHSHELVVGKSIQGSGCHCCQVCNPPAPLCYKCRNTWSKRKGFLYSRCITEADPVYNVDWCKSLGGKIKPWCEGGGCLCCYRYKPRHE